MCGYRKLLEQNAEQERTFEELACARKEWWKPAFHGTLQTVILHVISHGESPQQAVLRYDLCVYASSWNGTRYVLPDAHLTLQGKSKMRPKTELMLNAFVLSLTEHYFYSNKESHYTSEGHACVPARRMVANHNDHSPFRAYARGYARGEISSLKFYELTRAMHETTPLNVWQTALRSACSVTESFHTEYHTEHIKQAVLCGNIDPFLVLIEYLIRRITQNDAQKLQILGVPSHCKFVWTLIMQRFRWQKTHRSAIV